MLKEKFQTEGQGMIRGQIQLQQTPLMVKRYQVQLSLTPVIGVLKLNLFKHQGKKHEF